MKNKNRNISLERAYDIIKKPITTEKSTNLQQYNQYSFVVSKNSTSICIFCLWIAQIGNGEFCCVLPVCTSVR